MTFKQIIDLYAFDQQLRLLLFDSLEKIEVAFRAQIIYQWAMTKGSHWQVDPSLYRDSVKFARHIDSLQKEVTRCNETFIDHYLDKYNEPSTPPAWMSLEVSSLGLPSQIFKNLKKG